jgi:glycosyltransferase involved in cell wall biosynthesis
VSLALGVPVIGSRIRGMTELLEGDCSQLVPVGDLDGLTMAMARVPDHPDEAAAIGRRGRERMADFDLRPILHMHEVLYDEALKR